MRILLILLSVLAFAPGLYCEEKQERSNPTVLVYPRELLTPLPDVKPPEGHSASVNKEEFVEVESEAYPGLNFDLPQLDELISIEKFQLRQPAHGAEYYQMGGNPVLSYYGIVPSSGQLFSAPLPTGSTEKEEQ